MRLLLEVMQMGIHASPVVEVAEIVKVRQSPPGVLQEEDGFGVYTENPTDTITLEGPYHQ